MNQSLLDTLKQAREALTTILAAERKSNRPPETVMQAEEKLDAIRNAAIKAEVSIANLTAAIAELGKAEPVAWIDKKHGSVVTDAEKKHIISQSGYGGEFMCAAHTVERAYTTPLFLHPSDDEKLREDAEKWREYVKRQRAPAHSCNIPGCAVCDPTYGL